MRLQMWNVTNVILSPKHSAFLKDVCLNIPITIKGWSILINTGMNMLLLRNLNNFPGLKSPRNYQLCSVQDSVSPFAPPPPIYPYSHP